MQCDLNILLLFLCIYLYSCDHTSRYSHMCLFIILTICVVWYEIVLYLSVLCTVIITLHRKSGRYAHFSGLALSQQCGQPGIARGCGVDVCLRGVDIV